MSRRRGAGNQTPCSPYPLACGLRMSAPPVLVGEAACRSAPRQAISPGGSSNQRQRLAACPARPPLSKPAAVLDVDLTGSGDTGSGGAWGPACGGRAWRGGVFLEGRGGGEGLPVVVYGVGVLDGALPVVHGDEVCRSLAA